MSILMGDDCTSPVTYTQCSRTVRLLTVHELGQCLIVSTVHKPVKSYGFSWLKHPNVLVIYLHSHKTIQYRSL